MGSISAEETQFATRTEEEEACSLAMATISSAVGPMVLEAVLELGVPEIIQKAGPGAEMSAAEIVAQLPAAANPEAAVMLDRMLRLLVSWSVLTFSLRDGVERVYGLGAVCKFFTKSEDGASLSAFKFMNQVVANICQHLKDAVLEGGLPFDRAYGMTVFEYMGKNPDYNNIFNIAMSHYSTITVKKLIENYKGFDGISSLVDVGGGTGATLNMIISKYPTIKGINFDLSHVIANAVTYPGIENIGGDMFVGVPRGDAIFLKWICHCWSDEHCVKFLKKCHVALPDHGKVIACDYILPVVPQTNAASRTAFQLDAIMLAQTGGKERTALEFEALAKQAGFETFHVACSAYDTWVMEFLKKN